MANSEKVPAPASVNDVFTVRRVNERTVSQIRVDVDLSKDNPNAPPPDDKVVQELLQEFRAVRRNRFPNNIWRRKGIK